MRARPHVAAVGFGRGTLLLCLLCSLFSSASRAGKTPRRPSATRRWPAASIDVFERDLYLSGVEDVRFAVREGVVTLSGRVRHYLDRSLVASLVASVPGVQAVVNELEAAPYEA